MGNKILMPKLGMTMESGVLFTWLCKEGDRIEKGDPVAEVETDKVNLEVESLYEGVILKLYAEEGDTVPINEPIAYIGEEGEQAPEVAGYSSQPAAESESQTTETPGSGRNIKDSETPEYDVAVIGGGPGGYVAAIRAAQEGAKVVLIEKQKVGGTCLNRGCIPTKSFAKNAAAWRTVQMADEMGINIGDASFSWKSVLDRKNSVVDQLVTGVETLLQKHSVDLLVGTGNLEADSSVSVTLEDGQQQNIMAKNVILATGTVSAELPIEHGKGVEVLNTDQILDLQELPKSLAIIGGGVVGVEFASIMATFGVEVSIIELMPRLLPTADEELSDALAEQFLKQGIKLYTDLATEKIEYKSATHLLTLSDGQVVEAEHVLLAVGRKPETDKLQAIGVDVDDRGYIQVNNKLETSKPNVYAIGDVTGKMQLAHVASAQALVAVENLMGKQRDMDYSVVPNCIFTFPEVASVGAAEEEVRAKNIPFKTFKFPFYASGKALALGDTKGFVKIIADSRWDEILGVHIIGPKATDLIAEAVVAMQLEATAEELSRTIHAHPTLSEAVMEAAAGINDSAIHI